jgi:D-arabinono-1,4-lactone oxidase
MTENPIIAKGSDGYYHPASEDEIVDLVLHAVSNKLKIRVRGASHSTGWSIFTDPVDGNPPNRTLTRTPPASADLNLAMDNMIRLEWIDLAQGIVEAEAGIHLGHDPYNPIGISTAANSLLQQLFAKGWALNDLGGITHQTVSGFTATGSAGGSLIYDLDNVVAYRVVDGTGQASWIERGDPLFPAMQVHVGLMGIVTKIRLKCNPTFTIKGREVTTKVDLASCPIDLFGAGTAGKPSLRTFLEETPYSRILWWPQKGAERVVIWEATRTEGTGGPGYKPVPYEEFAPTLMGWIEQLAGSVFFVLLGNDKPAEIVPKLVVSFARFRTCLTAMWTPTMGAGPAAALAALVTAVLAFLLAIPIVIFMVMPQLLTRLFPVALDILQPLSKDAEGTPFDDYYWSSLPMDNSADDILLGTEFTEIWVPLQYTERCMDLLNGMFEAKGPAAIGTFSTEIYAAMPSTGWLSPSYSDGTDEYKDGVVRFDVFWFRANAGEPNLEGGFYQQYWDLFRDAGIPFRFHWGKFVPGYDFEQWADHYRQSLPRLGDFLAARQQRDPHDVFFTTYWRQRLTGSA